MRWLAALGIMVGLAMFFSACVEEGKTVTPVLVATETPWYYSHDATVGAMETRVNELEATMTALLPTMDARLRILEATATEVFATAQAYAWSCPTSTPTPAFCARCRGSCPEGYFCKECAPYVWVCVRVLSPNADCLRCLEELR
jgi:hypothetical protein